MEESTESLVDREVPAEVRAASRRACAGQAPMSTYSGASLARIAAAAELRDVVDAARALMDSTADHWQRPGEMAETGHTIMELARAALRYIVVHERLKGSSWAAIGEGLGGVSKQAAQEAYGPAEKKFRRDLLLGWLLPTYPPFDGSLLESISMGNVDGDVDQLNEWYAERQPPLEPKRDNAIGAGLKRMQCTEAVGLLAAASALIADPGAALGGSERHQLEIGAARRKIELYEEMLTLIPDDEDTMDVLAGARVRLGELEAVAQIQPLADN